MKTSWFKRNGFSALSSMALAAITLTGCGAETEDAQGFGYNEEVASTSQALTGPTYRPTNAVTSTLMRGDFVDAITTTTGGNQIGHYELKPTGWAFKNLTTLTGAPSGAPSNTFVRSDDRTDVLFTSGGRLYDLSLWNGTWTKWDLSAINGGKPRGYVRSDGVSAIVWGSADNHVRELSLQSGGWVPRDLTAAAGYTPTANINFGPTGYVRGDGVTAVVFCSDDGRLHELSRNGSNWIRNDLTAITGAGRNCLAGPDPFVRPDGVSSISYISSSTFHLWNLTLQGGVWRKWNLTTLLGAPPPFPVSFPVSYVRSNTFVILYLTRVNGENHIYEVNMSLSGQWSHYDLTLAAGAPPVQNVGNWHSISATERGDGTSQVLFRDSQNHLQAIYRSNTATTWSVADLTQLTAATP